jgi:hypothetical protein
MKLLFMYFPTYCISTLLSLNILLSTLSKGNIIVRLKGATSESTVSFPLGQRSFPLQSFFVTSPVIYILRQNSDVTNIYDVKSGRRSSVPVI